MMQVAHNRWRFKSAFGLLCASFLVATAAPAHAQNSDGEAGSYLDALTKCRSLIDDGDRLACFDREVAGVVAASEAGDVRVVDREQMTRTRRSLFGFNLPDLDLFGNGDDAADENELFETTITQARYASRKSVRFTTAEGATWEMRNVPRRLRTIEPGDTVVFKPASLGYYFVRIDGQMGVKGRRIR